MKCLNCGKQITPRSDRVVKFCSKKCNYEYKTKEVPCYTCGTVLRIPKSNKHTHIFCSKECYLSNKSFAKWRSEQVVYNPAWFKKGHKINNGERRSPQTEFKSGWQHTPRGKEIIKKRAKTLGSKQSKAELKAIDIIKKTKLPFKFVGNGELIIGTKNPDFIYTHNGRKIIEIFSDYWHRPDIVKYEHQTEEGTIKYYNEYGYNVLIIWEHELKVPNKVIDKINDFLDTTLELDVSDKIKKEITDFAVVEFNGNLGMCLAYIWNIFTTYNPLLLDHERRLNSLESDKGAEVDETNIKLLTGKKLR